MTVRQKMLAMLITTGLIIALSGGISFFIDMRLLQLFNNGEEAATSIVSSANEVNALVKRIELRVLHYCLAHGSDEKKAFFEANEALRGRLSVLEEKVKTPEGKKNLNDIKGRANELYFTGKLLIEEHDNDLATAGRFDPEKHKDLLQKFNSTVFSISDAAVKLADQESGTQDKQFSTTVAAEIIDHVRRSEAHLLYFLLLHQETDRNTFFTRFESLQGRIALLDEKTENPLLKKMLEEIRSGAGEFLFAGKSLIDAHDREMQNSGRFDAERYKDTLQSCFAASELVQKKGLEFAGSGTPQQAKAKEFKARYARILRHTAILFSVLAALITAIGFMVTRSIVVPLGRLRDAASAADKGKLDVRLQSSARDEIGYIANSINKIVKEWDKSAKELTAAQDYIDTILKSMTNALIVIAPDGVIRNVSAATCTMLGYEGRELAGRHIGKVLQSESVFRGDWTDSVVKKGFIQNVEKTLIAKDGRKIPVLFSGSVVQNIDNEVLEIICVAQDISERKVAEQALQQANEKLTKRVSELEQRNREIASLSEMGSLLHTCNTAEEAYKVIAQMIQQIFFSESGAVYLLDKASNILKPITVWGDFNPEDRLFPPHECWALRRGRVHITTDVYSGMLCQHLSHPLPSSYVCVPMMAQGEVLGLLHLQFGGRWLQQPEEIRHEIERYKQQLATTVSENIALSLSNLELRQTLYLQSSHDLLTGLFNRRYMEETLKRELQRMTRKGLPLGIIMLDIDRFKQFNDMYGHEAGDVLLGSLGAFLQKQVRGDDFACRYGGEEFVLVMPEASLDITYQRAEQIREEIKRLEVRYQGLPLGTITLSMGVAAFPKHGTVAEVLVRAADAALYRAKTEGRDLVIAA